MGAELLFPPFNYHWANGLYQWLGYGFIMQPPEMQGDGQAIVVWDHAILEVTITAFLAITWYLVNRRLETGAQSPLSHDQQPVRFH